MKETLGRNGNKFSSKFQLISYLVRYLCMQEKIQKLRTSFDELLMKEINWTFSITVTIIAEKCLSNIHRVQIE